jgi:hypothetical protein
LVAEPFDFKKKKVEHRGIYEYCVLCWQRTDVRCDAPVQNREGYVEGVGQLCSECFARHQKDSF